MCVRFTESFHVAYLSNQLVKQKKRKNCIQNTKRYQRNILSVFAYVSPGSTLRGLYGIMAKCFIYTSIRPRIILSGNSLIPFERFRADFAKTNHNFVFRAVSENEAKWMEYCRCHLHLWVEALLLFLADD